MSAVDVREVRARMIEAADGLDTAADRYSLSVEVVFPLAYASGVLRTLAATILPPDPPEQPRRPIEHPAAHGDRDERGRFSGAKS